MKNTHLLHLLPYTEVIMKINNISSIMEADIRNIVDTEKFAVNNFNVYEKILLGLFLISLSLR